MVEEHKPATFECTVSGTPQPEIKWYRGEREIQPTQDTEILFNPETGEAKLSILKPNPEDEIIYRVRAVNKFGRAECRANLVMNNVVKISKPEVLRAPKITKPLPALVAERGKPLTLSAEFDSTPQPQVKWFRNGVEITPSDKRIIKISETTAELSIPEIVKQDSGKYEIRVVNSAGEARSSGSVTVKEHKDTKDEVRAPRFIEPIQPLNLAEREVALLEAKVESYPEASFQWFHETKPLEVCFIFFAVYFQSVLILSISQSSY